METYLTTAILDSISKGDVPRLIGFVLTFYFIWLEVRGLKKEVAKLNETISKTFADNQTRFKKLEENQISFEHRLTMAEQRK